MGPHEVLEQCQQLVSSFNPAVMTVDAHAMEQLGDTSLPDAAPHKVFIQQVLYGCVRYRKPLKVFLSNFYHDNGGKIIRSDYTLYQILAYLAVFRLDELGFQEFQRFVASQEPGNMHIFLEYLWNPKNLEGPIFDEWLTIFDREYIEGALFARLRACTGDVSALCEELAAKAFGLEAAKKAKEAGAGKINASSKKGTVPKSPRLTKPKPRPVPEPIKIVQGVKSRDVADVRKYMRESKSVREIQEAGQARRCQVHTDTAAKYSEKDEFTFHETYSNLEAVRSEMEAQREAELQFDSFRAKKAPKFPESGSGAAPEVKLNVASVLREDALYKSKQAQEASMIHGYESSLRDANEFYRWQTEMRERDHKAKMSEVERRRLEMVQSAKDALEARDRHRRENKDLAGKIKDVAQAQDEQRAAEKELTLMTNKQLVSEVIEVRSTAPRLAERKVLKERQRARQEVQADIQERVVRKEREQAIEQAARDDRVRQIRALESVLAKAETGADKFDSTTTMNQGMLEQMSLVELKERLAMVKVQHAEHEAYKRKQILSSKREKADDVKTRVANIQRVRKAASASNKDAKARRRQAEAEKQESARLTRNAGNIALANKLAARRDVQQKEAQNLVDEEVRIANQRMFLGAATSMLEEKHFDQQLLGAERELREKQTRAKNEQKVYEATKAHARASEKQQRKNAAVAKRRFIKEMDAALVEANIELSQKKRLENEAKKAAFRAARVRDGAMKVVTVEQNLYAAEQSTKSLERGKALSLRRTQRARERSMGAASTMRTMQGTDTAFAVDDSIASDGASATFRQTNDATLSAAAGRSRVQIAS
jgi:hypothetical protein